MEIEKKYLLSQDGKSYAETSLLELYFSLDELKESAVENGKKVVQGYLPLEQGKKLADILGLKTDFEVVEARLREKEGQYYLTLKGEGGLSRGEVESWISKDLFDKYWPATEGKRIEKDRLKKFYKGNVVEIDVYKNLDLVIAEVEIPSAEEAVRLIPLGKDVSEDPAYKNKNLAN